MTNATFPGRDQGGYLSTSGMAPERMIYHRLETCSPCNTSGEWRQSPSGVAAVPGHAEKPSARDLYCKLPSTLHSV